MGRDMFDLGGKVTLVTGGNSGLGLGFARGCARKGSAVEIWARNEAKNAEAVAELSALGIKATARAVDVSSREQVVAGYAARLAEICREHPYNWFNFYDFWEEEQA